MSLRKIRALLFRQGVIREAIELEQKRPMPDGIRLFRLKRLSLALKDQLHRLTAALDPSEQPLLAPATSGRRRNRARSYRGQA